MRVKKEEEKSAQFRSQSGDPKRKDRLQFSNAAERLKYLYVKPKQELKNAQPYTSQWGQGRRGREAGGRPRRRAGEVEECMTEAVIRARHNSLATRGSSHANPRSRSSPDDQSAH